tara:strand:+ start:5401 stop:5913 length:513 start_codon:yes stop_codon:yes gene_type:complete
MKILGFFLALAMVVGFASTADAGWNIKQRANGSAVWENGDGETAPIGAGTYVLDFPDIGTASTQYVSVHRDGQISNVYLVSASPVGGAVKGDSVFTILIATETSKFAGVSGYTLLLGSLSDAGSTVSDTPDPGSVSPAANTAVKQGGIIAVHSDGAATGATDATVTIIIE